jgi:hypothetical protein
VLDKATEQDSSAPKAAAGGKPKPAERKSFKVKTVAEHVESHPAFGTSMGADKAAGGSEGEDENEEEELVE